jgi:hypothetical protein
MTINAESFQQSMMNAAVKYTLSHKEPGREVMATILEADYEDDNQIRSLDEVLEAPRILYFNILGKKKLPAGSIRIIDSLAGFSRIGLGCYNEVRGVDWDRIPHTTYALGELLSAIYPRNTRTGIIKMHLGGMYLDCNHEEEELIDDDTESDIEIKEYSDHRRLAGLGIVLMDLTRSILGPLMDDDQILMTATQKELFVSLI